MLNAILRSGTTKPAFAGIAKAKPPGLHVGAEGARATTGMLSNALYRRARNKPKAPVFSGSGV